MHRSRFPTFSLPISFTHFSCSFRLSFAFSPPSVSHFVTQTLLLFLSLFLTFLLAFCFPSHFLFPSLSLPLFFSLNFFSFSIIRSLSVSHSFSFYLYLSPFFLILTLFLPPPLPSYLLPFLSLHFLSLLVFPLPLLHSNVATEAPGSCMLPFSLKMA